MSSANEARVFRHGLETVMDVVYALAEREGYVLKKSKPGWVRFKKRGSMTRSPATLECSVSSGTHGTDVQITCVNFGFGPFKTAQVQKQADEFARGLDEQMAALRILSQTRDNPSQSEMPRQGGGLV
jgi:hypothetical protein